MKYSGLCLFTLFAFILQKGYVHCSNIFGIWPTDARRPTDAMQQQVQIWSHQNLGSNPDVATD